MGLGLEVRVRVRYAWFVLAIHGLYRHCMDCRNQHFAHNTYIVYWCCMSEIRRNEAINVLAFTTMSLLPHKPSRVCGAAYFGVPVTFIMHGSMQLF